MTAMLGAMKYEQLQAQLRSTAKFMGYLGIGPKPKALNAGSFRCKLLGGVNTPRL